MHEADHNKHSHRTPLQAATAPSATDILQGQGSSGQSVAAAGNMTRAGFLPWEAGDVKDTRKLWASVSGLQSGVSYTVGATYGPLAQVSVHLLHPYSLA